MPHEHEQDTIVALASPPGPGGIAVLRISGPDAVSVAARLFRPRVRRRRGMHYGRVVDPSDGRTLDDCLLLMMPGPHSYTGEDVVELQCHGSPLLADLLLRLCLEQGARAAFPGEFTLRAYLAGRLDLTQAEAVAGLVAAQTEAGLKLAAAQGEGALGRRLAALAGELVRAVSSVEVGIDFPEDEYPAPDRYDLIRDLAGARAALESLRSSAPIGRTISQGASVVIIGPANAGKSSLFNALLERQRAIVDAEPGTTRDVVEAQMDLGGIPLRLFDTVGVHPGLSAVEQAGMRLAEQARLDAELVLIVIDLGCPGATDSRAEALKIAAKAGPALVIGNKADLPGASEQLAKLQSELPGVPVVAVSALTGSGLDALRAEIRRVLVGDAAWRTSAVIVSTARQEREVAAAIRGIDQAAQAITEEMPWDVCLVGLYAALDALARAVGRGQGDVREDVLQEVFSRFCVGK